MAKRPSPSLRTSSVDATSIRWNGLEDAGNDLSLRIAGRGYFDVVRGPHGYSVRDGSHDRWALTAHGWRRTHADSSATREEARIFAERLIRGAIVD